ncbi:Ion-trans-2 domain-containing protein [Aphelenchoides besseyi]|nr:Ion-trans-2 domain-containing protein [Aphelenchoides besseyi]
MTRDSNNNVRPNLYRVGSSFRRGADNLRATFSSDAIVQIQRVRRVPRWVRLMHKINNHYGLKHVCLIGCLIGYQLLGAMVFYFCEHSNEQKVNDEWRHDLERNRTLLVHKIINSLFNNTEYLFFLSNDQTTNVQIRLESDLMSYEKQLGIRSTPKKQNWDYWTAALYAQMISTTIGGGFVGLQVDTSMGRLFTMLYVCGGVPLMLAVLDDLGTKIQTKTIDIVVENGLVEIHMHL